MFYSNLAKIWLLWPRDTLVLCAASNFGILFTCRLLLIDEFPTGVSQLQQ